MTLPPRSDEHEPALAEILGWAKGAAKASGSDRLMPRHIVLGALKTSTGRELLSEFLGKPFGQGLLTTQAVAQFEAPADGPWPLSEELKRITDRVWGKAGGPKLTDFLKDILQTCPGEREWLVALAGSGSSPGQKEMDPKVQRLASILEDTGALRAHLGARLVGQECALRRIVEAYFAARLEGRLIQPGDQPPERQGPAIILTLAGPHGCGKTLAGTALSEFLLERNLLSGLLVLDMSTFTGSQSHEPLTGVSETYKGAKQGQLTKFIEDFPFGLVLVKGIERAHANTRQLFAEALDSGKLYDQNLKKVVDFSNAVFVFTTALGRDLYDDPGRSGVLGDSRDLESALWASLGPEGAEGSQERLSPALISGLSQGRAALFGYLNGLDMEQLAQRTFREISENLEGTLGLTLEVADDQTLSLLVLRYAGGGDARRLQTGLRGFTSALIQDFAQERREELLESATPALAEIKTLQIALEPGTALPDSVREALASETHLLLVDDDDWTLDLGRELRWTKAGTIEAAREVLTRDPPDAILLDLHIGSPQGEPRPDQGLSILRHLRSRYSHIPIYLFSEFPERRGLLSEVLERVSQEGGARGIFPKRFAAGRGEGTQDRQDFLAQLIRLDAGLRRERLVAGLRRQSKVIEFDVEPDPVLKLRDGILPLWVRKVREVVAVSPGDRTKFGWAEIPQERFSGVAGADQAKGRLKEVVGWLKAPALLRDLGLAIPRGILLTGPPGTGKTTLARATAGEAQVPFFAISASEVLNKYIGESEGRVRDLFARARRYAPAIIFLDELDSIGGRRDMNEDDQWRTSILNELLSQMDGFGQSPRPVFVLAATNRADLLDPALKRPGRFDMQVEVPLPNLDARVALLEIHSKEMAKEPGLDFGGLARRLAGMSGAEIRQVCQEAGLIAFREGRRALSQADLEQASTVIRHGLASEQFSLDEFGRRATAVHEAGHAVVQHVLLPDEQIDEITILPRGGALGFVESASRSETPYWTRHDLDRRIQVLLAGRAAEILLLGKEDAATGASEDLQRATSLALRMVGKWGMCDAWGPVSLEGLKDALGTVGEGAIREATDHARQWLIEQAGHVSALLEAHRNALDALATLLVEKETLYARDVAAFWASLP